MQQGNATVAFIFDKMNVDMANFPVFFYGGWGAHITRNFKSLERQQLQHTSAILLRLRKSDATINLLFKYLAVNEISSTGANLKLLGFIHMLTLQTSESD